MRHKTVADIIVEISLAEEVKHCERTITSKKRVLR
jgi:hypothetical protein